MAASCLHKTCTRSSASLFLGSHSISQAQLARVLGISRSLLWRILRGLQPFPEGLDVALRVALGWNGAATVLAATETKPAQ